jgi:hypothetical protein
MSNRRAFPRIPGSQVPWLSAFTGRCPVLRVLDISDGGALIESATRWSPGERGVFVLRGSSAVKVAGWIVRAEIAQLLPCMAYRTAVRFGAPITISSLNLPPAGDQPDTQPPLSTAGSVGADTSHELRREFTRVMRALPSVHAVRVAFSLRTLHGTESVHFAVPESAYGHGRVLQVFFHQEMSPTAEEFTQLRHLAILASGLPDIDFVRSDNPANACASPV